MANYEYCVLTTDDEIKEYEEGLYKAFVIKRPDKWIIENYIKVEEDRIRPKYSYDKIIIYAIKKDGKIISASAINYNTEINFQVEDIGFKIKKDKNDCEGITFFILEDNSNIEMLTIVPKFNDFFINDLKIKGFKKMYMTCPEKLKNFYERAANMKVLGKQSLNNENEFLMEKIL
jgi:hypothetical protein